MIGGQKHGVRNSRQRAKHVDYFSVASKFYPSADRNVQQWVLLPVVCRLPAPNPLPTATTQRKCRSHDILISEASGAPPSDACVSYTSLFAMPKCLASAT